VQRSVQMSRVNLFDMYNMNISELVILELLLRIRTSG